MTRLERACSGGGLCRCERLKAIAEAARQEETKTVFIPPSVAPSGPIGTRTMAPWTQLPPDVLAAQLRATAMHEAGHAVTAFVVGKGVVSVTITIDAFDGSAGTQLTPLTEKSPAAIVGRIITAMAGNAVDRDDARSAGDLGMVHSYYLPQVAPRCTAAEAWRLCWNATRELVHDAQRPIERVADALIRDPFVLTGAEVERLVATDLASLRFLHRQAPEAIAAQLPEPVRAAG